MTEKKTIMVVEDDMCIREALDELLLSEQYNVLLAGNGQEALQLLTSPKTYPSLILLDLSMPVMNGTTFMSELKRQFPTLGHIPILTMTAAGPGEIPENMPMDMVLRKPLDVDTLLKKLENILSKSSTE